MFGLPEMLSEALEKQASDLHFYRRESEGVLRYRVSGQLTPDFQMSTPAYDHVVSLVKLRSGMDVSLHHIPQDGRFSETVNGVLRDFRVSTLPTPFGEDIVLRVLHAKTRSFQLATLGTSDTVRRQLHGLLGLRSGLLLVTGPTGSGKTTTLYTCLHHIVEMGNRVIVSIEDPVEAVLPGVRQTALRPDIGYDAKKALKAILRQDPDVILVGEIRDAEMAQLALEAAYTGHLVLSALHTSDVASSLRRMQGFGLDPFLLQHAIKGVLSQRLRPVVCTCTNQQDKGVVFESPPPTPSQEGTFIFHERATALSIPAEGVFPGSLMASATGAQPSENVFSPPGRGQGVRCAQCHGTGISHRQIETELFIPETAAYWAAFLENQAIQTWPETGYLSWQ